MPGEEEARIIAAEEKRTANAAAFYERIRKRIVDEDNVINHRMMWGTLAQTGLFAGFGLSNIERIDGTRLALSATIALVGVLTAALTFFSIQAARSEIHMLVRRYRVGYRARYRGVHLGINVMSSSTRHLAGHMLPICLPLILMTLWLLAMLFVCLKYWGVISHFPAPPLWQYVAHCV